MTTETVLAIVAGLGWGIALLFVGLFMGQVQARRYIENLHVYGVPKPQDASFAHPYEAEDRLEDAIDIATGKRRSLRVVREDDSQPQYDPQTIENGVEWLLAEARTRGEQLSEEEAREEAIRMLNAEGPEMA